MGRMIIIVAVSAPIAIIGVKGYTAWRTTGHLFTAVLLTGLIGLLALRKPLVALPFVMLTWFLCIAYAPGGFDLLSHGVMLAWSVSAPLGWGLRRGMRRPRSMRFTLKQMMTSVTVVAISIVAVRQALTLSRSSQKFRRLASQHAVKEWGALCLADLVRRPKIKWNPAYDPHTNIGSMKASSEAGASDAVEQHAKKMEASAAYHRAMRIKYEQASCIPWLPVERDPPEPK